MLYILELKSLRDDENYRLKKDRTWRVCRIGEDLKTSDYTNPNNKEIISLQERKDYDLTIGGKQYRVEPGTIDFLSDENILTYTPKVLRRAFPPNPKREQLKNVISKGDDNYTNSLILNVQAAFELRRVPPYNWFDGDPGVIIRNETFEAGNDYVGVTAGRDNNFVDGVFKGMLYWWEVHLITGKTNLYVDYEPTDSLVEIMGRIDKIQDSWQPQY